MKNLSNIATGLIRKAVGNNLENDEKDVLSVKTALGGLGWFEREDEPHGIITRPLDNSIKGFQRDKGLRVDGRIHPGGETETAIKKEQAKRQKEEREKQEEKRKKCAQLRNDLRIARTRLEGIDRALVRAIEKANEALSVWQKTEAEHNRRSLEAAAKSLSSLGKGPVGVSVFVGTTALEVADVTETERKAMEAKERHRAAQDHVEYLQKEKQKRYKEVEQIQKNMANAECR